MLLWWGDRSGLPTPQVQISAKIQCWPPGWKNSSCSEMHCFKNNPTGPILDLWREGLSIKERIEILRMIRLAGKGGNNRHLAYNRRGGGVPRRSLHAGRPEPRHPALTLAEPDSQHWRLAVQRRWARCVQAAETR